MENVQKYIITGPRVELGGVASFVKNIASALDGEVAVFRRGSESRDKSLLRRMYDSILLPNKFTRFCENIGMPNVLVNSSLSLMSMIRDGLLVRKSKALGHKTVLFIHGFQENALKYEWLLKWGYFKADRIIVLADEFKRQLEAHGYRKPIFVSLNPIEDRLYQQTVNNDLNPNLHGILFLARIERSKGIFEALQCFKILKGRHPELTFNVAGDGSARAEAEKFVSDNGIRDVIFHGFTKDESKVNLLNNNLLLLLTSHREGLPITVLEAMAAGQIILTRPVGGLVDLHKQCDFGVMTDSLSPEDFANAFDKYYTNSDLMQQTRRNNQEFAKIHFHPSIVANKIRDIFDAI